MKNQALFLLLLAVFVPAAALAEGASAPKSEDVIVTTSLEIVR